jgi:DNA-binding response OmpR family regulator
MNNDLVKVLLVDDDEDDYVLTRDWFEEMEGAKFELDWVASYDAALEAIARHQHDVYLFDYRLGDRNGLELLREAVENGCKAPIILLTGQGDHEVDVEQ